MNRKQKQTSTPPEHTRVIVADASWHFRETLRRVLEEHLGCTVAGEAGSLAQAVKLARSLRPDVVLLDIDLVLGQPRSRLRRIADAFPNLQIIVMLNGESRYYRLAVAERWGYRCIVKDQADYELARIIAGIRPVAV
jgi:DNA-binding NarL/FixJ family response regulator